MFRQTSAIRFLKFFPGVPVFLATGFLGSCNLFYPLKNFVADSGFVADSALICRSCARELSLYDIRPGMRVADIGYGYGHILGALVLCRDSLQLFGVEAYPFPTFYGDSVLRCYAELRTTPSPTIWQLKKGSQKRTGLPDGLMHRIIIRETYHHFKNPGLLMPDIIRKLRPDGRLYIVEEDVPATYYSRTCKSFILNREELIHQMTDYGLKLYAEDTLRAPVSSQPNWAVTDRWMNYRVYIFEKAETAVEP
jgi:SAM-dependent methyltransferase